MIKIEGLNKKEIVYQHFLKDRNIDVINCEESIVNHIQKVTGDFYQLRYLGIDARYEFCLALGNDEVLGYSIVQKYFENPYFSTGKGRVRGEPGLVYSLERKKGVGSLLFLVSSLEILKDKKVEIFRCEAVQESIFDRWCSKLDLNFIEKKEDFNVYESVLEGDTRECLEKKIKKYIKPL